VKRPRSGYTLLELVLVVVIIALIAVMATPSLHSTYLNLRLTSAADQVRAAWATARLQAVNEGRPYRFGIIPNKGNYRVAPDDPAFWSGSPPTDSGTNPDDGPTILEAALPKGVRLAPADGSASDGNTSDDTFVPLNQVDPSMYVPVVTFLPDGTSREDVTVVFTSRGIRPLMLRLRGITGAATVVPVDANGQPLTPIPGSGGTP
jgi:prepilin-type N-terminal cleavage/methylation domain-containing protein